MRLHLFVQSSVELVLICIARYFSFCFLHLITTDLSWFQCYSVSECEYIRLKCDVMRKTTTKTTKKWTNICLKQWIVFGFVRKCMMHVKKRWTTISKSWFLPYNIWLVFLFLFFFSALAFIDHGPLSNGNEFWLLFETDALFTFWSL